MCSSSQDREFRLLQGMQGWQLPASGSAAALPADHTLQESLAALKIAVPARGTSSLGSSVGENCWRGQHEGGEAGRAFLKRCAGLLWECLSGTRSLARGLEWSVAADRSARTPEEFARALGWSGAICLSVSKCPHHYFRSPTWTPAGA